jgi:serralysin
MAINPISADTSTTIVANTFGDIWVVENDVDVTTSGKAIDGTGSNGYKTFLIYGNLIAQDKGIALGTNSNIYGGHNRVFISSAGSIYSNGHAIDSLGGQLHLSNEGSLFSTTSAIFALDGYNTINNSGTINSAISGDGIITAGNGNLIVNSGSVIASSTSAYDGAIDIDSVAGEANRLVNNGELAGQVNAVVGRGGDETVVNRGTMDGNVVLGAGNDVLRNAGDVSGDVDLGTGNDLFKGWDGTVDGSIHGRAGNDTIIGGISDDAIFGDSGNDVLKGGQGDDTLNGGPGRDLMRGGAGLDTFDFNKTSDSAVGAQRDHILDFSKADDVIDVAGIDAKTGVGGNQAFHFIGAMAFSGTKGELRAINVGADAKVLGDVDGDGHADFSILVADVSNLHAGDFVL